MDAPHRRPTVADLRAAKGTRQLSMLHVTTLDEAAAAEVAGIDILSIIRAALVHALARDGPPRLRVCGPALWRVGDDGGLPAGGLRRDDRRGRLGLLRGVATNH